MCPEDLVALVSALTIRMAKDIPPEELALYSEIFLALGESITLYLVQKEYLENCRSKMDDSTTVF